MYKYTKYGVGKIREKTKNNAQHCVINNKFNLSAGGNA